MKNEINTHDIKKIVDQFNVEVLVYFRAMAPSILTNIGNFGKAK